MTDKVKNLQSTSGKYALGVFVPSTHSYKDKIIITLVRKERWLRGHEQWLALGPYNPCVQGESQLLATLPINNPTLLRPRSRC